METDRPKSLLVPAGTLCHCCVCVAGILLGIAIRTGSPLSLTLAEPVWKQLAGMPLSVADLMEVDKDYVPGRWTWFISTLALVTSMSQVGGLG